MKITQASVLGLLGATSAAVVPSARRPEMSTYPRYPTVITVATSDQISAPSKMMDKDTADKTASGGTAAAMVILAADYYNSQPYACYRQDLWYFPPQALTAGSASESSSSVTDVADSLATQSTTVRAFWQVVSAQMGTLQSPLELQQWTAIVAGGWASGATVVKGDTATGKKEFSFGGNAASGDSWACCFQTTNQQSCNGGVDTGLFTGSSVLVPNRIVIKRGITRATMFGGKIGTKKPFEMLPANQDVEISDSLNTTASVWTFNDDILMSSMYQSSITAAYATDGTGRAPVASATTYCDRIHHEFADKSATQITAVTSEGFNGSTKCTYQVSMAAHDAAPAMKIMKADYRKFLVHYMEWMNVSALPTNHFLPATDASLTKIGVYSAVTTLATQGPNDMLFLNPMTGNDCPASVNGGVWPQLDSSLVGGAATGNFLYNMHTEADPQMWIPGSVGKVVWLPGKNGQLKNSQWTTFDSSLIQTMYDISTAGDSAFTALKNTYETDKTAYNDAVKKEKTRLADAAMDPPIEIPTRPCPPTAPASYMGPQIANPATANAVESVTVSGVAPYQYVQGNDGTTALTAELAGSMDVNPYFRVNSKMTTTGEITVPTTTGNLGQSNRMGWLQAAEDVSTSVAYTNELGHVFGRLGQGEATLPGASKPFAWLTLTSTDTTSKPSLQISMFPEEQRTVTGIGGTTVTAGEGLDAIAKTIEMVFSPREFATVADLGKPTAPTAPGAPDDAISAVYLAATSSAAVALALATLY